jgi:hypothetical protein
MFVFVMMGWSGRGAHAPFPLDLHIAILQLVDPAAIPVALGFPDLDVEGSQHVGGFARVILRLGRRVEGEQRDTGHKRGGGDRRRFHRMMNFDDWAL